MKTPFTYTILRYVHDIFTGEFLNVGVVVYVPKQGFLQASCLDRVKRLGEAFPHLKAASVRKTLRFTEQGIERLSRACFSNLRRDSLTALDLAKTVLPIDHSSFQWSPVAGGLTDDPEKTLEHLYARMVSKYEHPTEKKKDEKAVWKPFERILRQRRALTFLQDVTISHGEFNWHFEHAWKNGQWNVFQPVSFDLIEKRSIVDKAAHWGARVKQLRKANTDFKIYMLLGKPADDSLMHAFEQAAKILREDVPGDKEVVLESEAPIVAEKVADEILKH